MSNNLLVFRQRLLISLTFSVVDNTKVLAACLGRSETSRT